jgi:hypothetical protein
MRPSILHDHSAADRMAGAIEKAMHLTHGSLANVALEIVRKRIISRL